MESPLYCVMCYAEDEDKVTRKPADFVANGHSVCFDHVDDVLEAG